MLGPCSVLFPTGLNAAFGSMQAVCGREGERLGEGEGRRKAGEKEEDPQKTLERNSDVFVASSGEGVRGGAFPVKGSPLGSYAAGEPSPVSAVRLFG